jgi:hypothetical protein
VGRKHQIAEPIRTIAASSKASRLQGVEAGSIRHTNPIDSENKLITADTESAQVQSQQN